MKRFVQACIIAAARPYIVRELFGWGKVYHSLVGEYRLDHRWKGAKTIVTRNKVTNQLMTLDLSKWPDRASFFLGRWYSLDVYLAAKKIIREGDTVIDIGANRGMFSLAASHLCGPKGNVVAFESNPECIAKFKSEIALNRISNITVHDFGLSDRDEELDLKVPSVDSGAATFTASPHADARHMKLRLRRGDDVLAGHTAPSLIKIDVEGFEMKVLGGLAATIDATKPALLTEVGTMLENAGSSSLEMFDFMVGRGYRASRIGIGGRHSLALMPLQRTDFEGKIRTFDVLWLAD